MTARIERTATWVLLGCAACACAFFAFHTLRAISFPYPLDYGEGPLLEQGRRLAHGANIYRPTIDDYPFLIANYPPVFPALLALVETIAGPSYVAARCLTGAATLACAYFVAAIARRAAGGARIAQIAGALFLASPYVVFWSSLVRIDLVALAFTLAALHVIARNPSGKATPFIAAALVALACFTRQSHLLAAPLAATVSLAVVRRRAAAEMLGTLAATLAIAALGLQALSHGGFAFHVVAANVNAFSSSLLAFFAKDFLLVAWPLFLTAVVWVARPPAHEPRALRVLVVSYLFGALTSALTIGKVGSHVNYFLEAAAALAMVMGVALGTAATGLQRIAATATATIGMVSLTAFSVLRPENIESKLSRREEFRALADRLHAERGLVLADETMGMLVITGHDILLQPFEFTQLARQGRWDQRRVLDDLRQKRFAMVLVNDTPATPESWVRDRWTPEMLEAIHTRYRPDTAIADATIYVPTRDE